jgi:Protein CHAPERONE-LIKE PROTEIN OF POR1-like
VSSPSPYETLGITEEASFEEIQAARVQLSAEFSGDPDRLQAVESAYDTLLMERLRLRQEGKIKVPDGIRFAEKAAAKPVATPKSSDSQAPWSKLSGWNLGSWLDQPQSTLDWVAPTVTYLALGGGVAMLQPDSPALQAVMALATGSALFFVYRKHQKIGRSALLGFSGLILGFLVGGGISHYLRPLVPAMPNVNLVISWTTFTVLWAVSSFLK